MTAGNKYQNDFWIYGTSLKLLTMILCNLHGFPWVSETSINHKKAVSLQVAGITPKRKDADLDNTHYNDAIIETVSSFV